MGNCFSARSKSMKNAPLATSKILRRRNNSVAPFQPSSIHDSVKTLQGSSHFLFPGQRPPFFTLESTRNAKKTMSDSSRFDSSPDSLFGHSSVVTKPASRRVETAGVMGGRRIIVQPCASRYSSYSDDSLPGAAFKRPIVGRESRASSDAQDEISNSVDSFSSWSESSGDIEHNSEDSLDTEQRSDGSLTIEDLSDDQ